MVKYFKFETYKIYLKVFRKYCIEQNIIKKISKTISAFRWIEMEMSKSKSDFKVNQICFFMKI